MIIKSEFGIGLDLVKTNSGGVRVKSLKEMPNGLPNPASQCNPSVLAGDIIVGINGMSMKEFSEVVKAIRNSVERVEVWLERD